MIELYSKGTVDFSRHGIALAAQQAAVTYQDNGRFDMDLTMPYDANIAVDYGMILRCPVPAQEIGAITLGPVSYYEISAGLSDVPLYSKLPSKKKVSYTSWQAYRSYMAGDKVTYGEDTEDPGTAKNWRCTTGHGGLSTPPPQNPTLWTQIPGSQTVAGTVAAELDAGDTVIKTGDYNATYMKAVDTAGHEGWIEIAKCTDMSQSGTRTVPAQSIRAQSFVITEITKSSDGRTLTVHAEHISYELGRVMLGDCNISRATPATALMIMRGAMQESYGGEVETSLTEDDALITADFSWKNAQSSIMDPKAGLLQATGARMIRNDLDVYIIKDGEPGTPRYRITYGTNLKAIKWDGNVGDLVTRIYPIAQNEDGSTLLLPEEHIDTVRTIPYVRPEALNTGLKVGAKEKQEDGTEITLDEDTVFARMREQANNRFTVDECDKATITLEVDWQHLPDTAEYAQYSMLRNTAPGEWVEVDNAPLGIYTEIQLTGYTFDPILGRYKKGTFGKKKAGGTVAGYEIANGAVTGRALAAGAVGSQNIQANCITAREIEAGSITADKIASRVITTELLQAGAVTADEISAGSVTAEKIAAYAITADKIDAGAITADKIAANAITAVKIDTNSISAINAKLGTATITNGMIDNANISYARIMDASVTSLIAKDAITDTYYIDKLQVRNAQMVTATVGELIVKASDDHYYRLDFDGTQITPTDVTNTLLPAEITAGVTSDGHSTIIETDLVVADLSASNMKAINALIDKITASRIDVYELWARQAFINQLMVTDISSNSYIQSTIGTWTSGSTITQTINSLDSRISSLGYGTVYMQPEEPDHAELVTGDIWIQTLSSGTWAEVYDDFATWAEIYNGASTWQTLGGVPIMWVWDGRKWQKQLDSLEGDTLETEIRQNAEQIQLLANRTTAVEGDLNNKYTIRSGITITAEGIDISGSQYVKIASGGVFAVTTGNFGIDSESSTYVLWAGAGTAAGSPFWLKKDGSLKASSGTIGGWTLASDNLSAGSGSSHIELASSGTYAMWAGAASAASAPFRLKPDGTLYITSLIAVGENGSESTVNLRTAGLWKLSYGTIKSLTVSGGYCTSMTFSNAVSGSTTVNFRQAVSVNLTGSWSGRTFTVTETGSGQTYSETPTYRTGTGYGQYDSITVDSFNSSHYAYARVMRSDTQGGNVLFGFKIDANSQYEAGWLAGYNAAAGKVSVSGSSTGTIHFPKPTTVYGTEEEGQWSVTADVFNTAANWYMAVAYIDGTQRASRSRQFS